MVYRRMTLPLFTLNPSFNLGQQAFGVRGSFSWPRSPQAGTPPLDGQRGMAGYGKRTSDAGCMSLLPSRSQDNPSNKTRN